MKKYIRALILGLLAIQAPLLVADAEADEIIQPETDTSALGGGDMGDEEDSDSF